MLTKAAPSSPLGYKTLHSVAIFYLRKLVGVPYNTIEPENLPCEIGGRGCCRSRVQAAVMVLMARMLCIKTDAEHRGFKLLENLEVFGSAVRVDVIKED